MVPSYPFVSTSHSSTVGYSLEGADSTTTTPFIPASACGSLTYR